MERDEVLQLLQVIQAYDSRKNDEIALAVWSEAARRGRWTLAAAVDAVHAHNAETAGVWLTPGHVTERIRAVRRTPPPVHALKALPGPPPAGAQRRREVMALVHKLGSDGGDFVARREQAMTVRCPHCRASAGEPCATTDITNRSRRPLKSIPAHPAREALAREEVQSA